MHMRLKKRPMSGYEFVIHFAISEWCLAAESEKPVSGKFLRKVHYWLKNFRLGPEELESFRTILSLCTIKTMSG